MKFVRFPVFVLLVAGFVLLTGCNLFSGGEPVDDPGGPGDPGGNGGPTVFFADDFSEVTAGEQPQNWTITGDKDYLHVVADTGVESGKAVRMLADPNVPHTSMRITIPEESENAKTIIIEHKMKWVEGKNNIYVTKDLQHRLHWWVEEDGRFRFNRRREDGTLTAVTLGNVSEGWNHIRVVANIETEEILFYLNNMDEALAEPYIYGRPISSWAEAHFQISHTYNETAPQDIYYGDIKIWTTE